MKQIYQTAIFTAFVMALASGCTKQRPATFPDGQGENVIEKAVFAQTGELVLAEQAREQTADRRARASTEKAPVTVVDALVADVLRPMFVEFDVAGTPASRVAVGFEIDKKHVTAFKVVANLADLSVQEAQISRVVGDQIRVPIFQYDVKNYGVLERAKNDLGEETRNLRLKDTDWNTATHIEVSTRRSDRKLVAADIDAAAEVFVTGAIDGQVLTRAQVRERLGVTLDGATDGRVLVKVGATTMHFLDVAQFGDLTDGQKEAIRAQDRGGRVREDLKRCPEEIRAALAAAERDACVVVLKNEVTIAHVAAKRKTDLDGIASGELVYDVVPRGQTGLVRVTRGVEPRRIDGVNQIDTLSPHRTLVVSNLKDTEFLFRRTMQDSPNGFDYSFTGLSGDLEIVKFVFERDRVRVVRAEPLLKRPGSNPNDREDLMIIPARYVREQLTDAQGNPLAVPALVPAEPTEAGAIAYVDWTQNRVPNVSSPLNYYDLEQCFTGAQDKEVSLVDHRLNQDGVLSLTISSTYAASTAVDCAGLYVAGYFDRVQTNFTFKERISFKRYVARNNETPLADVPYDAQKRLGFGLFTYKKKIPNRFGNTGGKDQEIPLPAIFDLREGRSIQYVLAGLPEDAEVRARVISATQEVIADWNVTFRRAFAGTSMQREADVISLVVEDAATKSEVGDLDRNYIYYVDKATSSGVIGLGGAHSNPRSGLVEAANVFVYGGNILSAVETLKKMAQAEKEYLENTVPSTAAPQAIRASSAVQGQPLTGHTGELLLANGGAAGRTARPGMLAHAEKSRLAGTRGDEARKAAINAGGSRASAYGVAFAGAFQEALDGGLTDARAIGAAFDSKFAELPGVPAATRRVMQAKARQAKSIASLRSRVQGADYCLYDAAEVGGGTAVLDQSDLDVAIGLFKATLAHELGHNLGLRHNFGGSFDAANFKHADEAETTRKYSSIMDYLVDDHANYGGLGPYDVAAIRAGYAGVLALESGQLASLNAIKQALGKTSWVDLTAADVARVPLKKTFFCSDEDVYQQPGCAPFDKGGTPAEIVQHAAEDYRTLYSLSNFAGDRARYDWWDSGYYVGRLFTKWLPARLMVEETIYQAINGGDRVGDYVDGAVEAMRFFHGVIRQPDAPTVADGLERFVTVALAGGQETVVERKWLENLAQDDVNDRLRVRGIELDKVVAMILLTERRLGVSRYERANLRISFPEFEAILLRDVTSPLELPSVSLLNTVLSDNIVPQAQTHIGAVRLGSTFRAATTELMRFYAVLSTVVSLDVDGLEAKDNLSTAFRVLSGMNAPAGLVTVQKPGSRLGSVTELKLWAPETADSANAMMANVAALDTLVRRQAEFTAPMQAWLRLKIRDDAAGARSPELEASETALDAALATLPDGVGSKTMAEIGQVVTGLLAQARQVEALRGQLGTHDFALLVADAQTRASNIARLVPTMALAIAAAEVLAEEVGIPVIAELAPYKPLDRAQAIGFQNLELSSVFLGFLHPELQGR